MSYDLLVFDPDIAPIDRVAFLEWYESHDQDSGQFDPTLVEFSTPKLRLWLEDILNTFPAMNGPYSNDDQDVDDPNLTDYAINRTNIYACFAWSMAESAYNSVMSIAQKHGLAVFDISHQDGKIWRPGNDGVLS